MLCNGNDKKNHANDAADDDTRQREPSNAQQNKRLAAQRAAAHWATWSGYNTRINGHGLVSSRQTRASTSKLPASVSTRINTMKDSLRVPSTRVRRMHANVYRMCADRR